MSQILELVSHFEGKNWISKTRGGWTTFFFIIGALVYFWLSWLSRKHKKIFQHTSPNNACV